MPRVNVMLGLRQTLKDPSAWPTFSTELAEFEAIRGGYHDFKILHVPRAKNKAADDLARTTRIIHRDLLFIGCFVPVKILRPIYNLSDKIIF